MEVEGAVVARARAGDPAALDELLRQVRPLVVRRCRRVLPYPQDAEEATQDALLAIATKLGTWSGRGTFEAWAGTVATNKARMTYRVLRRRSVERGLDHAPETVDPARTSVVAGTRLDLLDAIEALEEHHGETVEALVMRDLGGLAYEEIATIIDVPLGTVKARIHTARGFLRPRLTAAEDA